MPIFELVFQKGGEFLTVHISKRSNKMSELFDLPTLKIVDANKTAETKAVVNLRFVNAISDADDAFWAAIAQSYPEINTGDLEPGIVIQLKMIMETAVASWLIANAPQGTPLESLVHSDFMPDNVEVDTLLVAVASETAEVLSELNKVALIKETYPVGTRVRLDEMHDDPNPIESGTYGAIESVDDAGQLHVKWDNDRSLALIPDVDVFTVLSISLEEFIATKEWSEDIEKTVGFDNESPNMKGYVYKGTLYIQKLENGKFYLPIERDEIESDELAELEKILYDRHFSL